MITVTNKDRCSGCSNKPKRQGDWFYCNNPNNFKEFETVRLHIDSYRVSSKAPKWCIYEEELL